MLWTDVNKVDKYAASPYKTVHSDICNALHYASDERKTVVGGEKAMYVTEMNAVQERFDKLILGVLPKNKEHRPLSPEMREACRRLDVLANRYG